MTLKLMQEFRFSCGFRNVAFWLVGVKFYPQVCLGRVWSASVMRARQVEMLVVRLVLLSLSSGTCE
jgi:hypothetical protein